MNINSGQKNFSGKRVIVFIETQDNPLYYQYLYAIARKIQNDIGTLSVVFLDEGLTKRNLLKMFRFLMRKRCQSIFSSDLQEVFGAKVSICKPKNLNRKAKKQVRDTLDQCNLALELLSLFPDSKYLGLSLHSFFCSALSMSSDPLIRIQKYRRELERASLQYFSYRNVAQDFLSAGDFDYLIFTNGRTPEQAVFKELAEFHGIEWLSLEHGAKPGLIYHLENFQTQDRVSTQVLIKQTYNQLNKDQVRILNSEFEEWKLKQETDKGQNVALLFRNVAENPKLSPRILPIFTSSIDEEVSCPGWSTDNVRSLTEKTIELCKEASGKGWEPLVVVHPNTLNKKWHDLFYLMTELRKNRINSVMPWDPISSYQYLSQCKLAITWRSTIGLEAIIQNKNLKVLSDTTYDETVGIKSSNLAEFELSEISVNYSEKDIFLAKLIIYYYNHYGYSLNDGLLRTDIPRMSQYARVLPLGSRYKSIRNRIRKFYRPFLVFWATPQEFVYLIRFLVPKNSITDVMFLLTRIYRFQSENQLKNAHG